MKPNNQRAFALALALGLIIAGVSVSGTQASPWNLFLVWLMPVTIIQVHARKRNSVPIVLIVMVVLAGSIVGLMDTMGAERATSIGGALICL
jgi:hypothetical protein